MGVQLHGDSVGGDLRGHNDATSASIPLRLLNRFRAYRSTIRRIHFSGGSPRPLVAYIARDSGFLRCASAAIGRALRRLRLRPPRYTRPLPGMRCGADGEGGDMKRLLRWVFKLVAMVSAVLFAATSVLWPRSCRIYDCVQWLGADRRFDVSSAWSCLDFEFARPTHGIEQEPGVYVSRNLPQPLRAPHYRPSFGEFGVRCYDDQVRPGGPTFRVTGLRVRYVVAALIFASFPGAYVAVRLRRCLRRPGPGFCHSCGYDLRATPDRCPECGAVSKSKGAT